MPRNVQDPEHPEYLPPPDTPLWRYISLAKFISLLQKKSVFMNRADLYDDKFEGTFTRVSVERMATERGYQEIDFQRWIPCCSFLSCWHISAVESMALWKVYGGSEGSVAIRSSIGSLKEVFPEVLDTDQRSLVLQTIRMVRYIDYRTTHPELNDLAAPLIYKRLAFSFEREVRVIRQELLARPRPETPGVAEWQIGSRHPELGLEIEVDLNKLIHSIHLAPNSPPWVLSVIKGIMDSCGVGDLHCYQSSLDELPEIPRY